MFARVIFIAIGLAALVSCANISRVSHPDQGRMSNSDGASLSNWLNQHQ